MDFRLSCHVDVPVPVFTRAARRFVVDSLFIVAPFASWVFVFGPCLLYIVLRILSSLHHLQGKGITESFTLIVFIG